MSTEARDVVTTRQIEAGSREGRAVARRNRALLIILVTLAVGMGGFGFALTRAYTLLCQATGSEVRPNDPSIASAAEAPTEREIEVYFERKIFDQMPVRFYPDVEYQKVKVGTDVTNVYHFQNLSNRTLHFRPIHQIDPPVAAKAFGMKLCFCFNDQTIGPGETKDFTVQYRFAPTLHENVSMVRLCYSLHEIDDASAERGSDKAKIDQEVGADGAIVTPGYREGDAP
jgi:cytochrome c oxidase assembly protein subunit 11